MDFKLVVAFVNDDVSERVLHAARKAGATGSTIISNARGEGLRPHKTFLGLNLTSQCDVLLFLVSAPYSEAVLQAIDESAGLRSRSGAGLAFQIDVEKAVGVETQLQALINNDEDSTID